MRTRPTLALMQRMVRKDEHVVLNNDGDDDESMSELFFESVNKSRPWQLNCFGPMSILLLNYLRGTYVAQMFPSEINCLVAR